MKKGEKAAYVVFYKEVEAAADSEADGEEIVTRLFARATPVFAVEQVDNFRLPAAAEPDARDLAPIDRAERVVTATGAAISHGGARAFYRPSTDTIHMPERAAFVGSATSTREEAYYSTLLHELTRWIGVESRCNRQFGKRFGDHAYAVEKLVAELGAAFFCAELGVSDAPRAGHAQYLSTWLDVLKSDKRAIFAAASRASQAAGYLASFQGARTP